MISAEPLWTAGLFDFGARFRNLLKIISRKAIPDIPSALKLKVVERIHRAKSAQSETGHAEQNAGEALPSRPRS